MSLAPTDYDYGEEANYSFAASVTCSNEETRQMVAREFSAARKTLFDTGNAREGKLYLFSGIKSLSPALKKNDIFQPAKVDKKGVVQKDIRDLLDVNQFRAQFEGFSSNNYRIKVTKSGVWGQARIKISDDGGRTWSYPALSKGLLFIKNSREMACYDLRVK